VIGKPITIGAALARGPNVIGKPITMISPQSSCVLSDDNSLLCGEMFLAKLALESTLRFIVNVKQPISQE
ncbi:hypothetical protein, partial [Paenibacillus piscarius]|uniref:hypothetical protein n=1 Tax=Paenibacillus piscarius TaxID=1089681 RepID=UPI001EE96B32